MSTFRVLANFFTAVKAEKMVYKLQGGVIWSPSLYSFQAGMTGINLSNQLF